MEQSAVTTFLEELSEELDFPSAVRDVVVKDHTGAPHTLASLLDARPKAILTLGRNLL